MTPDIVETPIRTLLRSVAATCLLFAAAVAVPVLGLIFALLMPLPVLYARVRLGRRAGAAAPAAAGLLVAATVGVASFEMLFFGGLMAIGFVMAELLLREVSVERAVLQTSGVVLGAATACVAFYAVAAGLDVSGMIGAYVERNLQLAMEVYQRMGISAENMRILSEAMEQFAFVLTRMLPALAVSSALVMSWATLLMARSMLIRRGVGFPDYPPLKRWRPPEPIVWAAIACGGALLVPDRSIRILALNGLVMLMTVYFFAGIAIVSYYFQKKRFPMAARAVLYALIAVQQFFLLAVIGMGFFDTWFDFRKLESQGE